MIVVPQTNQWQKLKALVLDSVSSPITKRVYHLGLNEFFAWYGQEARPGFTKATVSAWRVALEARGLGSVSINVRITAVRKLAVEAADNGLLAPELAAGITRVKGAKSKGVRVGNVEKLMLGSSPTVRISVTGVELAGVYFVWPTVRLTLPARPVLEVYW